MAGVNTTYRSSITYTTFICMYIDNTSKHVCVFFKVVYYEVIIFFSYLYQIPLLYFIIMANFIKGQVTNKVISRLD